jgi:anti-sigma factor RsiW
MSHDASPPEPTPASPSTDEELVAYLDGELDAQGCRRLEQLLASDPQVRQRLQDLEQTWQLLDHLERCDVDEGFTRSTLEMVAVAAEEEVRQIESRSRRLGRWLLGTGGLAAAAAAGFLAVVLLRPDPNRRLLEDLPVLENFDEYRQVDDIDFLRELDRQGLFAQEQHDGS